MSGKLAVLGFVVAIVVAFGGGFATGVASGNDAAVNWAEATESRYARDMFCYAPNERAKSVLTAYESRLLSRKDDSFLWKREYAITLAALATVGEKTGKLNSWELAIASCRQSSAVDCSEERLKKELLVVCSNSGNPAQ